MAVAAKSRRLLGRAMSGPNTDAVIHGVVGIRPAGEPVDRIAHTVHIHPTVPVLVPTTLQQLKPMD